MKTLLSKLLAKLPFLLLTIPADLYSQADSSNIKIYQNLSLEELLKIRIVSVSRKTELLFDAPLSASVVTKEEIRKAGSTSIMEALRLVPGMIVREQSNGNYDIHLRGMDNVPVNAPFDITSNTTTLVMIDNRPVYSYLMGGTFWETLPIDLNDVERIEVVRGPAAALYGPNAVNGVINIITCTTRAQGFSLRANAKRGSLNTNIGNVSIGYQKGKLAAAVSGNYQGRDRSQTSYFEFTRNREFENPPYFITFNNDTIRNVNEIYPRPQRSMKKYGGNIFLHYDAAEKIKFNLSTGIQNSWVQKVSTDNEITPLSTAASNSRYVDLQASIKALSVRASYNKGTQVTEFNSANKYDFEVFDANIEYSYTRHKLQIKPGISFTNAIYDDTKYSDVSRRGGIFNTRGRITSVSVFLRGEYRLLHNKLRLIAGLSSNTFNVPDDTYLAYEFAATYKLNKSHLLRAVYSKAPRSSSIFNAYVDQALALYPTGYQTLTEVAIVGNKNLALMTANMLEFGYRGTIIPKLILDLEVFGSSAKDYSVPITSHPIIELDGRDTIHETPIRFTNVPLVLHQYGITASLTFNTKKIQIKPFFTLQHTNTKNGTSFINTPDADVPGAAENNIYSGMGSSATLQSTPTVFGGGSFNYLIAPQLNVNLGAYYSSAHIYQHVSNTVFHDGIRGIDHINRKLIVNANITYEPWKGVYLFCSGKNILNERSREFFRTDDVPLMVLAGFNIEFIH